jgi:hypothetical protein
MTEAQQTQAILDVIPARAVDPRFDLKASVDWAINKGYFDNKPKRME